MRKQFDFYADPGHGWLKCNRTELNALGIENQISCYSYQRGNDCFLEEDCDATLFINTYKTIFGEEPEIKYHCGNKSSKIRSYNAYTV